MVKTVGIGAGYLGFFKFSVFADVAQGRGGQC
ncbi:MAG: hypothetical protein JWR16_798 [Nevskia sp.]|nr:hypothetical protein [Nevskia sp.]